MAEVDLLETALAEQGFRKVGTDGTFQPEKKTVTDEAINQTPASTTVDATDTTKVVPPPPAQFDETKWLNEKFKDRFKTTDELVNFITDAETSKGKYSDIEKRYKDLETEYADAKPVNDYIKGLNKFVKDGGDPAVYNKVQAMDLDKMNERDALVNQLRVRHNISKTDAEFKVDKKYKLGVEGQFDENDPEVREARIDMKLDADSAKEYLRKYKAEKLVPPGEQTRKAAEQAQLERMNEWKPRMSEMINGLKKIELPYDGQAVAFDVPAETLSQLQDYMQAVIEGSQFKPDADGISAVKQLLMREILFSKLPEISQTLISQRDAKWKKEVHNPSGGNAQEANAGNVNDDKDTKLAKFIAQVEGTKYR